MKKLNLVVSIVLLITLAINASAIEREINKTFPSKEKIKVKTINGNLTIKKGAVDEIKVNIIHTYNDYEVKFEFNESDGKLSCREDFTDHMCTGGSNWIITVPEGIDINFDSSSGDFKIENNTGTLDIDLSSGDIEVKQFTGDIELRTSSGDVTFNKVDGDIDVHCSSGNINAENINGEFDFHASSGNVEIENCEGVFEIHSSSGDVNINKATIKGNSKFSCSNGNADVVLEQALNNNITVSSTSGTATLDFNGNEIRGSVEMTSKVKEGKIKCPIKFENEKIVDFPGSDLKHFEMKPYKMVTKSFSATNDTPIIKIKTSSGVAKLVE